MLHFHVHVVDAFEEKKHPRNKAGRFAKKGQVDPEVHEKLGKAGFNYTGSEEAHYKNETGHKISFHAPNTNSPFSYTFQHRNPSGQTKAYHGTPNLAKVLNNISGNTKVKAPVSVAQSHPEPNSVKTDTLTPEMKSVVGKASGYLNPGALNKVQIGSMTTPMRAYATAKSGRIFLSKSLMKEHPAFVASVIFHELVHQGQDFNKMDSRQRELEAHSKTRAWANNQFGRSKDPAERKAFRRAYEEAAAMEDKFAKRSNWS